MTESCFVVSQDFIDGRPIVRRVGDMVKPNDTVTVDQHIAAKLAIVASWLLEFPALHKNEFQVMPNGAGTVDRPPIGPVHSISSIELTFSVNQQWPLKCGLPEVGFCHTVIVKGNHRHFNVAFLQ